VELLQSATKMGKQHFRKESPGNAIGVSAGIYEDFSNRFHNDTGVGCPISSLLPGIHYWFSATR
jgi:hypothetical protein